jgi:hypothetical protein
MTRFIPATRLSEPDSPLASAIMYRAERPDHRPGDGGQRSTGAQAPSGVAPQLVRDRLQRVARLHRVAAGGALVIEPVDRIVALVEIGVGQGCRTVAERPRWPRILMHRDAEDIVGVRGGAVVGDVADADAVEIVVQLAGIAGREAVALVALQDLARRIVDEEHPAVTEGGWLHQLRGVTVIPRFLALIPFYACDTSFLFIRITKKRKSIGMRISYDTNIILVGKDFHPFRENSETIPALFRT